MLENLTTLSMIEQSAKIVICALITFEKRLEQKHDFQMTAAQAVHHV